MGNLGIVIALGGAVVLLYGLYQRSKAGRVGGAPLVRTGEAAARGAEVAGEKGAISVEGSVVCPQPLASPLANAPCLYFEWTVSAVWQDQDNSRQSREVASGRQAAAFSVDDGSGAVAIDAAKGGDFPTQTSFDAWKEAGFVGLGSELSVGSLRLPTHFVPPQSRFHAVERVVPLAERLYVCGRVLDGNAIGSPSWSSLILSTQSRAELLGGATQKSRSAFIGGAVALALGVVLKLLTL